MRWKNSVPYVLLATKTTCREGFLIQLLERAVLDFLLLLLHIEGFDQVGYVVVVVLCSTGTGSLLTLLNRLIRLGEFSQRRERVGSELIKNAGDQLGELFDLSHAIDSICVC
jgi:hypothetical protein